MNTSDLNSPSNGPELSKACQVFSEFLATVAALRHPKTGCPWDLEQNHRTLARFMIEEAYEASEQMTSGREAAELCSELGDVLLQVVLNSQVALDEGRFSIVEVIQSINAKMLRRHPHVFGSSEERSKRDLDSIKSSWIEIKEQEKLNQPVTDDSNLGQASAVSSEQPTGPQKESADQSAGNDAEDDPLKGNQLPVSRSSASQSPSDRNKGVFQKAKVDKVFPAALKAHKIGEIARRIRFDWSTPLEVLEKLESELIELRQALSQAKGDGLSPSVLDELGDVYFSLNQLTRHLGTNGEAAAEHGNLKFLSRFAAVESLARKKGLVLDQCNSAELEELWREAKVSGSLT